MTNGRAPMEVRQNPIQVGRSKFGLCGTWMMIESTLNDCEVKAIPINPVMFELQVSGWPCTTSDRDELRLCPIKYNVSIVQGARRWRHRAEAECIQLSQRRRCGKQHLVCTIERSWGHLLKKVTKSATMEAQKKHAGGNMVREGRNRSFRLKTSLKCFFIAK